MESKEVECEGCNQVKTVPMVHIEGETYFEGICSGCVENYGMQVETRFGSSHRMRTARPK